MTQISITRALAQVKSLNDRIQRGTAVPFITQQIGGKHASGKAVQEVEKTLKASLQSVRDLIAERNRLKSAIVRSNAVAQVVIGGNTMTVAEAIERKTSIALEQNLLQQLRGQQAQVNASVERTNVDVQKRLEALLVTAVGKDRQTSSAELEAITGPFKAQNEGKAVDPNDLTVVIDAMSEVIDTFLLEVDYALSEINATTIITVA
ncbi:hypothetical protein phiK7A1_105 [Pseudomonas phage phiK7A1]|uniref:Tail fiber protein n=1 Tax=Pseudomonas phage phiK7A1 TaxID=2759194 RepID=A0A7H0XFV3_9CAUD|nr:hypothetical protein phiK7A1_105 [Pseudomonas phage phiK7A1]